MFEQFPKKRPILPKEIEKIFLTHYKANREGRTFASFLSKKLEAWLHKKVAEDLVNVQLKKTLEIGAGTLNQLQYEPNVGVYDIVEPLKELYQNSNMLKRIRNKYADIEEIPEN